MRRSLFLAGVSGVFVLACATPAAAAVIFSDTFNSYTTSNYGTQANTGLQVGAFGTLSNWTGSGQNAIHAVNQGSGDWAVMLYGGDSAAQTNAITLNTGIGANGLNQAYQVSFAGAAATYASASQGDGPGDRVLFQILRADNSVLSSYLYDPTDWSTVAATGSNPFQAAAFSYVGDGSGDVKLKVSGVAQAGHFGGAIDNLSVASMPEPATWAMMIGGFGLIGASLRRRRGGVAVSFG